ncbi:MAG: flagellar protein FlgN [Deltaproteobacteria bacterium]|nr:flagellar protein FlgN [Deltaproteobacteria bacterium]
MVNRLIDILEQEVTSYIELITLLQDEKRLLANRRNDELYQLVGRIESLAFKIRGLEDVCNNIAEQLLVSYNLPDKDIKKVNLSRVIEIIGVPHNELLKGLQSKLLALVEGVKELNQENRVIINRGIENINTAIMFLKDFSAFETYKPTGKMNSSYSMGV